MLVVGSEKLFFFCSILFVFVFFSLFILSADKSNPVLMMMAFFLMCCPSLSFSHALKKKHIIDDFSFSSLIVLVWRNNTNKNDYVSID
jgi:hypothetical protein